MPRKSKGPHLWFRPERRNATTGKLISSAAWVILDGRRQISTGSAADAFGSAQIALAEYIARKYSPTRRERPLSEILISDVLIIYFDDTADKQANARVLDASMGRLNGWWGGKTLDMVTGESCRAYAESRVKAYRRRYPRAEVERGLGGARRDLEFLQAAIRHHLKEGLHRETVVVSLPEKGVPRDRWLTRSEVAKLLWYCWRKKQVVHIPKGKDAGTKREASERYPLRHLARYIILGVYTGSRAGTIASASPVKAEGRSWVDLESGRFIRLQVGKRETKKRQPPAVLIPHVLSYLRRWARPVEQPDGSFAPPSHFVMWNGKPVKSVKTAFASAIEGAGIEPATPHALRHTAATWMMANGGDIWDVAGYLGMSDHILRSVYGHHHPDFQKSIQGAFRPKK